MMVERPAYNPLMELAVKRRNNGVPLFPGITNVLPPGNVPWDAASVPFALLVTDWRLAPVPMRTGDNDNATNSL